MKIEKQTELDKFNPITIMLTIESKDEHTMLRRMCGLNVSIPELVHGEGDTNSLCSKFLNQLAPQLV